MALEIRHWDATGSLAVFYFKGAFSEKIMSARFPMSQINWVQAVEMRRKRDPRSNGKLHSGHWQ